jgi:pimeloyl-ACP methyl ester carboxylesterase
MDDLVLHYDELLGTLGLHRPHLVGFSLGGWLAAELAVTYPDRFRSLTLINAAGLHVDGHVIPDIPALSREAVGEAVFYDPAVATAYFTAQLDPERRLRHYRALTTTALIAWNPWFDPKLERRLRRVRIPTLCLWAEHDRLIPPVYGERYHSRIPGSRLQILPNCGHMAVLEKPEELAEAISQFCAAQI